MERVPIPTNARFTERPRESVQFTGPESIDAVAELVRKYRPRINHTFDPVMGTLTFYGVGPDIEIKLTQWVAVRRDNHISVIPAALYEGSPVEGAE
ncbi:hypothetical protein [Microbacterium paraoxydans]|uniref:hypothetical protein n=1 Tax=Microbacterium paraoxydans TaxID=199592 RepID=UPI00046A03D2|nr:hypothetical protein [Microbacterium paraoxydans]